MRSSVVKTNRLAIRLSETPEVTLRKEIFPTVRHDDRNLSAPFRSNHLKNRELGDRPGFREK
jgi:hypothetical protein